MIKLRNVKCMIGDFSLQNINLEINDGEYFVILGPSGNGKTVLLKCIAGLYQIDEGEIWINGQRREHLSPEYREVGFVFQDNVLFPHLSVFDNISFGLKIKGVSRSIIKDKVTEVAETLRISYLLDRYTSYLSGGEKQRVALARAMVLNPNVLLLDEPYASLDRNIAEKLILEGKDLHRQIKQTTLHVTHNQEEAITLADRICVLKEGDIMMVGTPDEIFRKPNCKFVADFVITENIYNGFLYRSNGISKISFEDKDIFSFNNNGKTGDITFSIRPEDTSLYLEPPRSKRLNIFKGKIKEVYDKGAMFRILVDIGFPVVNFTLRSDFLNMNINKLSDIYLHIDEKRIHVFKKDEIH